MDKFKAFSIALGILLIIFVLGFFGINILMKIIVGHEDEVEVPSLIGLNFEDARDACAELNIYIKQTGTEPSGDIKKGAIISQSPGTGLKIKVKRTIGVIVSAGPQLVRVPYLTNLTLPEAMTKLTNSSLRMGEKILKYSDQVEKDKIIMTDPPSGQNAMGGSSVKLYISIGGSSPDSTESGDGDIYEKLLDKAGE